MKNLLTVLVGLVWWSTAASATTVQYSLSATATPDEYVVLFTTDAVLSQNQAVVISFPYSLIPPTFTNLENPIAGIGYNIYFHQPNNPTGANGDLILIRSAVGSGAVSSFSIEATYFGGTFPALLPYRIDQFDGSGPSANFTGNLSTGDATDSTVPEPSSMVLSLVGFGAAGYWVRTHRKQTVA